MKRIVFAALFLLGLCWQANAATCFWVGGSATWDLTNTTSWASTTGGAGGSCGATGNIPKNSIDIATFDANSGGGTVTVDANLSITTVNFGAFTGTVDFTVNNNNLTLSSAWNGSGTGARAWKCGTGTLAITSSSSVPVGFLTTTNLTLTCNAGTIVLTATGAGTLQNWQLGSAQTFGIVDMTATNGAGIVVTGAHTYGTLTLSGPVYVSFPVGTSTIGTLNCTGTSGSEVGFISATIGTAATISVAAGSPTCTWASFRDMTFAGGATFTATSSFDLKHNTGITITAPVGSGGGGGFVGLIGPGL